MGESRSPKAGGKGFGDAVSAVVLLLAALGCVVAFARPRPAPSTRRTRYTRWIGRALAWFLLPTVVTLALLGRIDALWTLPPEFVPARALLPTMAPADVVAGALGGVTLGLFVAALRARRGGRAIGRPCALMPRNRAELPWGAAVAVVAGVAEEPFFRLLLPLLIVLSGGSAVAGFALAAAIFAALHRYQGWRGMVATGIFGTVLSAMYLLSGALWLVVLLHVLVDLNGLVVWPALSSSAAIPSGRSR